MKYPHTRQDNVVEEHFGTTIHDPYRWLEDDNSPETIAWVKQQQEITEQVLNEYPFRAGMLARLRELTDCPRQGCPMKNGAWYYITKNDGLQDQSVTYRKRTLDGPEELFLDPNTLSEDGTTKAIPVGYSRDGKYHAYMISHAGADAGEIWVMDTDSKSWLPDKLTGMRHTGAAWYRDGFYYSRYDADENYQDQNRNQRIYYHKLGEPMEQDRLIYADPEHPLRYVHPYVSDDEKVLIINLSEGGETGNSLIFRPLDDENAAYRTLFEGFEYGAGLIDACEQGFVYLQTNKQAKNFRLVRVPLANPSEENWVEIIPERDYLMERVHLIDGKLIVTFIKDVQNRIEVLDPDGNFLYPVEMPYQGTSYFVYDKKEDTEGFFYFDSYVRPSQIFFYDVPQNKLTHYYTAPIKADVQKIVAEQVFFTSKDGTRVPMTLIYHKGLEKNGANPVLLYGYGGFNSSQMPYFSSSRVALMERGFIHAIVNLRGGDEYGEKWHEDGMLLNKQNVFDDFISAAEYMIREGYSNPDKLAIMGGSNGGLLVGACLTQRPDLFKAAVCMMGVLDMVRYHKFTCGWGWMGEYGNPDEEVHFHNVLKYSPLHNVKAGIKYPATLVTTADHDDRVVPAHSFKFAATLQEKAAPDTPQLLYTQFRSSHGPSNLSKSLELFADAYSFICKYLNVPEPD
jgi:prolyl oligopeptidase